MLVAITFNEKDCKRDIAFQDVQTQDCKKSSTKAAAGKHCPGDSSPHCQRRAASSTTGRGRQGEAPGLLKGSGTWGAQKGTWQWHFCCNEYLCCITARCDWYLTWESLTGFSYGWQKFPSKSSQVALMKARSIPSYSGWFGFQWHTEP